jgi:hypothetical protein
MGRLGKLLVALPVVVGVLAALAWWQQSRLIGFVAERYLSGVAESEDERGDLTERRRQVAGLHRTLLMEPPADALVPELFDVMTSMSSRVASGEYSLNWAAYVYTAYERDLVAERPSGVPRRARDEVEREIERYTEFYSIQKRPDANGWRLADLLEVNDDDVLTLEEIEAAEAAGKEIDVRTGRPRE